MRTRLVPHRALLLVLVVVALCGASLASSPAHAGLAEQQEAIDDKRDQIAAQIEREDDRVARLSAVVAALDRSRQAIEADVADLDADLARLSDRIDRVAANLTSAQQELNAITAHLAVVDERLDSRTEAFSERAVAAYKSGPTAYVDGLLSADSFADLVDRYSYYRAALDADSELIAEIELLKVETETKQEEVEERASEIAGDKLSLEQDRILLARKRAQRAAASAELLAVVDEKSSVLEEAESKKRRLEAMLAHWERESDSISQLLAGVPSIITGPLPVGGGQLAWPASGSVVSGYGYRVHPIFGSKRLHAGIDIGAGYGAPVVAAGAGRVAYVGSMSGYGNVVVIDHGGGLGTTYNHLSSFQVGEGQRVTRRELVGAVGCTGWCTGPHLHFEVRINGTPVDPMPYLE